MPLKRRFLYSISWLYKTDPLLTLGSSINVHVFVNKAVSVIDTRWSINVFSSRSSVNVYISVYRHVYWSFVYTRRGRSCASDNKTPKNTTIKPIGYLNNGIGVWIITHDGNKNDAIKTIYAYDGFMQHIMIR